MRAVELRAVAREVAAALWGRLFLGLRAARLELEDWMEAARRDRAAVLRDERALARQEELRADVGRAGWCLGVLAAAEGHDLLRARCERDGLRWLVGMLAEARGLALAPHARELPESTGRAGGEVAVLAAWCALEASRHGGGALRWNAEERAGIRTLAFESPGVELGAELAQRCARLESGEPSAPRAVLTRDRIELLWS